MNILRSTYSILILLCLFCAYLQAQEPRRLAPVPTDMLARILELEDQRNLNARELIELLHDNRPRVRERAALAIGRIGDRRGTEALIALLEHEEAPFVQAMAAFALGEIEDPAAVPSLLAVLEAGKSSLADRIRPVEALGKIAGVQANADLMGAPAIEEINARLLQQLPDPKSTLDADKELLVSFTITALMRVRSANAIGPLALQLKSDHAAIRAQAANALARLGKPLTAVVPQLIEALQDRDAETRANAARALGVAKDPRALDPLLASLRDPDSWVQVSAVRALASIKDPKAVQPLIDLGRQEKQKDSHLRNEIIAALGTFKDERALPFLKELRNAGWPAVKQELELALAQFGADVYKSLQPRLSDQKTSFCRDWKKASIAAQAYSAWLPTTKQADWYYAWYELFYSVMPKAGPLKCDRRSWPEFLRAVNKLVRNLETQPTFQPKNTPDYSARFFPDQLFDPDVSVRATAAGILGAQAREASLPLLIDALKMSRKDADNDAHLAILSAIAKFKSPTAIEAIKGELDHQDHLVRRRAVELLKQAGAGDFSDRIGIVKTGRTAASYKLLAQGMRKKMTAVLHTNKGAIRIELYPEDAPLTVDNFVRLARRGYFNNISFHRVVPNFVIQGGDPRGTGDGGPGHQIRCEINTKLYGRGAVGMALSGKDTGGSQFFITHAPQPHLDGGYTVFGQVIDGQPVADRILRGDVIRRVEIFAK